MICPDDQVCVHVTEPAPDAVCADPEQLADCAGAPEHHRCGANGRCYPATISDTSTLVCLAVGCGDGRLDHADPTDPTDVGEACDDGNQADGDGCSSDCRSTEVCGNGVVDLTNREVCDTGNLVSNDGCDSACQLEAPRWSKVSGAPRIQSGSSVVFDIARDRIVRFGGNSDIGEMVEGTWEGTPTGWQERRSLQEPPRLPRAPMTYDSEHHRVVLFDSSPVGGVWLWDGTAWTHPLVVGPTPRTGALMTYDAGNRRTIMFGGTSPDEAPTPTNETWMWDGTTWTLLTLAHSPPVGRQYAMAYDPGRGAVVLFGGQEASDVWELTGGGASDWHRVVPPDSGPDGGADPSVTYDPATHAIVMCDGGSPLRLWSWDGSTWTELTSLPTPIPKQGARVTTDVRRNELVIVGYASEDGIHDPVAMMWRWDGVAWRHRDVEESSASTGLVVSVYDARRGVVVAASGGNISEFDGVAWTTRTAVIPAWQKQSVAYDQDRGVTLVFGGISGAVLSDDMYSWNGSTASHVDAPTRPSPRQGASMVWDAAEHRAVLFGGACNECEDALATWLWNGASWVRTMPVPSPSARMLAASAYDPIRAEVVLFGGGAGHDQGLGDTWTWSSGVWTQHMLSVGPSPRDSAAMAWDASRQRIVLIGGYAGSHALQDVWEWDGNSWVAVAVDGFLPRSNPGVSSRAGGGVLMYGGLNSSVPYTDTQLLRWEGERTSESCRADVDLDGDGYAGCADPDCWWACTPLCPPGAPCDPRGPRCGDHVCSLALEDPWICPEDCARRRPVICGDMICDPSENASSCPGDCHS